MAGMGLRPLLGDLPRLREVRPPPALEEEVREAGRSVGIGRRQGRRAPVGADSPVDVPRRVEGEAERRPERGLVRIRAKRLPVDRDRLLRAAPLQVGPREVPGGFRVPRLRRQRALVSLLDRAGDRDPAGVRMLDDHARGKRELSQHQSCRREIEQVDQRQLLAVQLLDA